MRGARLLAARRALRRCSFAANPLPHPHPAAQASKKLRCWGQPAGGPATYHEMIAKDKEVVKAVLLLTGSVEGTKNQVGRRGFGDDPGAARQQPG